MGWKVDDENEYYLIYKTENLEEENINKLKSISQISESYVETFQINNKNLINKISKRDEETNRHNLSLPFELELLCHNLIKEKTSPKILIQINSNDNVNRHRVEGYCFLDIPIKTGFYQFEVPCYKPKEDNYMKVFSFFLGGSRKIPDLREIAKTSSKDEKNVDTVLNRYGISTEYVGRVCINLNVVIQNREVMEINRSKIKEKQGREWYNMYQTVNSVNVDDSNTENYYNMTTDNYNASEMNMMLTKNHGVINRYTN